MNLYFDTEFTGLHKDTTLISLGIIAENGSCFYAKLTDYDTTQVDDWIQKNVINNIELPEEITSLFDIYEVEGTKEEVKNELLYWLSTLDDDYFELVSDVCHYDMILFIDLFGTAFDLPENISPACWDINQDLCYGEDITLQEAFNINREQLLKGIVKQSTDDIFYEVSPILELGDNCKHNSLYDAIIIKYLYELM